MGKTTISRRSLLASAVAPALAGAAGPVHAEGFETGLPVPGNPAALDKAFRDHASHGYQFRHAVLTTAEDFPDTAFLASSSDRKTSADMWRT